MTLDRIDIALLAALCSDARASHVELAEHVGLSSTAVARRQKQLEEQGVITGYQAALGLRKLGFTTTEDERVWGSTEWGFGYQGPMYSGGEPREAASHIDGISLACSVTCDGQEITRDGEVVHPELIALARACGH